MPPLVTSQLPRTVGDGPVNVVWSVGYARAWDGAEWAAVRSQVRLYQCTVRRIRRLPGDAANDVVHVVVGNGAVRCPGPVDQRDDDLFDLGWPESAAEDAEQDHISVRRRVGWVAGTEPGNQPSPGRMLLVHRRPI